MCIRDRPIIPKMFPERDDSGCDKPLRANIKSNAEIRYNTDTIFDDIIVSLFCS